MEHFSLTSRGHGHGKFIKTSTRDDKPAVDMLELRLATQSEMRSPVFIVSPSDYAFISVKVSFPVISLYVSSQLVFNNSVLMCCELSYV